MTVNGGQRMENWGLLGHDWAVEMLKQQLRRDSVRLFAPGGRLPAGASTARTMSAEKTAAAFPCRCIRPGPA